MRYLSLLVLLFLASYVSAQKNVVDKIVAIVGEEIVLKSDSEIDLKNPRTNFCMNNRKRSSIRRKMLAPEFSRIYWFKSY